MGEKWLFTRPINRLIVPGFEVIPIFFVICIADLKPIAPTNYITKYAKDAILGPREMLY